MGKLQVFDIIYEHPLAVFHAGEVVKGTLLLTLSEPMKMRNLRMMFSGRAKVHWTVHKGSGNSRRTVHYRAEEVYIDKTLLLFGSLDGDGELHPAGTHTYHFEMSLGEDLPSSFEGEHGYVRYCCKVTIDKPWKFDHDVKSAFTVLSRLDLNREPEELRTPMQGEDSTEVSCCCCYSGDISARFRINKRAFVPGEPIIVYAEVHNKSNTTVKSTAIVIKQYTEFLGHSDSIFSSGELRSRVEKDLVGEACRGEIAAGQSYVWDNVALAIPAIPPSRLVGCGIINCTYIVKFYVSVNYGNDIKLASEVIIGTIPLQDVFSPHYGIQYTPDGSAVVENEPSAPGASNMENPPYVPLPPSYEECTRRKINISEEGDSEYTRGRLEYAPHYPFYRQLSIPETEVNRV